MNGNPQFINPMKYNFYPPKKIKLFLRLALHFIPAFICVLISVSSHAQGSWTQVGTFGGTPIRYGVACFAIDNKVYFVAGLGKDSSKTDSWMWDICTNTWSEVARFPGEGREGCIYFAINNKGYVGCGWNETTFYQDFYEYDPATNKWTRKADFGGGDRESSFNFVIGNKGYAGTGYNGGSTRDLWQYDPATDKWTRKADFPGTPRRDGTAFVIGNKAYAGTGYAWPYLKDFWEYDPATDKWTQKADFGGSNRSLDAGFAIGNKGYIGSGRNSNWQYEKDFWEYDPATDTWTQVADINGNARGLTNYFAIGCKGYVTLGADNSAILPDIQEFYDPSNASATCVGSSFPAISAGPDVSMCKGQSVTLNGSGGDTTGYKWSPAVGLSCVTCANPVANPTVTTHYFLSDAASCGSGSDSVTITVLNSPLANAPYSPKDTVCYGSLGKILMSGNIASSELQYSTNPLTGFTNIPLTGSSFVQLFYETTYFRVIDTNGQCSDTSAVFPITVTPSPTAIYSFTVTNNSILYNSDSSTNADSYLWDFGDGKTSTLTNPSHSYAAYGTYHVCLTVTSTAGCNFTLCKNITLAPNGVTSMALNNAVLIYPNPFSDNIFLESRDGTEPESMEIFDIPGKSLYKKTFSQSGSNPVNLDVSALPPGMYYIEVRKKGNVFVQKMIKQ